MPQIGELLRQERERKNLSLKDVENALNIRTAYLQAIEEGRFDVIPGEVYVKGFIRNYGNFLGLDGSQLVAMYREARQAAEPQQEAPMPPTQPSTPAPARSLRLGGWLWKAAGALLVVAVAVWYFYAAAPGPQPASPPPPAGGVSQSSQPSPADSTPQSAQPAPPAAQQVPPAPPAVAGVHVTAKFTDNCWLQVSADGKTIYEGTAAKGATMTWDGRDNIKITFGNAGAAEVALNGRSLGVQGRPGEVVEKTFSANTIKP